MRRERLASGPVSQNNFPSFRMWLDQQLLASWHLRLDDGTLPIDVPEGLELVALDLDNRVVVSNVADYPPGAIASPNALSGSAGGENGRIRVFLQPPFVGDALAGTLMARMPSDFRPARDPRLRQPPSLLGLNTQLYGLAALLLIAPFVVALFARSLNRSVADLDLAAARIAQGELDFELRVSGRDENRLSYALLQPDASILAGGAAAQDQFPDGSLP